MKRRVTEAASRPQERSTASPLAPLKRLDIYARPKREFQRGTAHGAVVTVVLLAAAAALTWRELCFSMKTEVVETLFVNSTISPAVNVTFDVVFSRIPCALLSLDAEDALGIPQENLRHDVIRTRLDLDGRPLDDGEKHAMGNTLKEAIAKEEGKANLVTDGGTADRKLEIKNADEGEGGSGGGVVGTKPREGDKDSGKSKEKEKEEEECNCYGAGAEGECCRTCADIKVAYRRKGWRLNPAQVPPCAGAALSDGAGASDGAPNKVPPPVQDEGCRLAGSLEVTRTEGNFHFAPGHRLHRHAYDLSYLDRIQVALESFNTTHTINTLAFGDRPPAGHASPKHVVASTVLDGHHKAVQDTHAMHQYFLQLVPTVYRLSSGATVHSNQYSATEHLRHVHTGLSRGLPGVYFYYQVSPVQALVEEQRRGLLAFLTGVCGVVGGVYSILGLLNTGIDGLVRGGGGVAGHRSR